MHILQEPRLIHETEDVHLLEMFLFSTKMNDANWRVSQSYGHTLADQAIGKDLYAIPDRIFKPIDEGRGGHTAEGTKQEEYDEIRRNSLGKIVSHSEPHYYEDGSGDYWYDGKVRLNGSKTASVLMENGSKTWIPFAVSAHIWPEEGDDDNITNAEFMGMGLVIQGAFGEQSVIKKYCSGSATVCEKSLTAAIQDVINNSFNTNRDTLNIMSQVQEVQNIPQNNPQPILNKVTEEFKPKEENKSITLTKEEYDELQLKLKNQDDLRTEVDNLRNEYKTNVLNQIFGSIQDENVRKNLTDKYFEKDVKLVKEIFEDITAQILPSRIEEAIKKAKEESSKNVEARTSKTASSLKPEPKKQNPEESSLTASVNDELSVNDFLKEIGL